MKHSGFKTGLGVALALLAAYCVLGLLKSKAAVGVVPGGGTGSGSLGGITMVSGSDNLSSLLTNMANGSTLLIGSGNWTNRIAYQDDVAQSNLFLIINKTNINLTAFGGATLWNTNQGDGLYLSNCSKVTIDGLNFFGYRTTNVNTTKGFGTIVLAACKDITIRNCRFDNSGNHTIMEGIYVPGLAVQNSNIVVDSCTFFNCGSWFPNLGVYDGACVQFASHWTVRNCRMIECARGVEAYGLLVPVVANSVVEGNYMENMIEAACMDGGQSNNYSHVFRNNRFVQNDGWRTVSSNMLGGFHTFQFGIARGFVIEGNYVSGCITPAAGGAAAIFLFSSAGYESKDNVIRNNTFTNCENAIQAQNNTTLIRGLKIQDNEVYRTYYGAIEIAANDSLVEGNTITDSEAGGNVGQAAIWIGKSGVVSTNNTVRNNIVRATPGLSLFTGIKVDAAAVGTRLSGNEVSPAYATRFADSGTGTYWNSGVSAINGGTNIVLLTGTKVIDFGSIAAGSCNTNHVTVTGCGGVGDLAIVSPPTNSIVANSSNFVWRAQVYATNVVEISGINNGGAAVDPGSGVYRVVVMKFNGDQ